MNKTRFLSILVVFLLVLNIGILGFFLFIAPKPGPPGGPPGGPGNKGIKNQVIRKLQLDDNQVEEYERLVKTHVENIRNKAQEMEGTRAGIFDELAKEDPFKKDSLLARIGTLQKEIETLHVYHFQRIKAICRPEQLPAFKELVSDLSRRFRGGGPPRRP
ncbi:MAG: periplasmic heavy metal sensor [Bacteroidota bacterium]